MWLEIRIWMWIWLSFRYFVFANVILQCFWQCLIDTKQKLKYEVNIPTYVSQTRFCTLLQYKHIIPKHICTTEMHINAQTDCSKKEIESDREKRVECQQLCECSIRVHVFNVCFELFTLIFQALCALHFRIHVYRWYASRLHVRTKLVEKLKGKPLPSCVPFSLCVSGFWLFVSRTPAMFVCLYQSCWILHVYSRTL